MNTSIVLTVIADDQPGIIETVSSVLSSHGGNWTQSSMSSLAGQFAGILLASVPSDQSQACLEQLCALESEGLKIIVRTSGDEFLPGNEQEFTLELIGNDRPGIVYEITTVLTRNRVSVIEFESRVESASMGGGELFKAKAHLLLPEGSDVEALAGELEDLANELMVDIRFHK